ncbi:hypothetical protein XH98_06605 [Bradyrhizobium sp. CCBAU 51745]|nr:hypothetical protein [Bradyrhizobium sp. CCBAU 51745]
MGLSAMLAIIAAVIIAPLVTRPERYEVIQTFAATGRGAKTPMGLAADRIGNVYGSTWTDGPGGGGIIFKLIPPSLLRSGWEMQVLWNVKNGPIGTGPFWSMIAQNDDLYGATTDGGVEGGGTLFKFEASERGVGEPIPLYHFADPSSPLDRVSELISDSSGSLYGTTHGSGGKDGGAVFKLSPGPNGWTMTILHRFAGGGDNGDDDGAYPVGGLTMDRAGVLYGSTGGGGKDGIGTVFKLTPTDHGWEESVIHTFRQLDGSNCHGGCLPMAGLTLGTDGTLYGTTGGGGKFDGGVVFSLTPSASGGWTEQVLYDFKREVGEGTAPNSRLVLGKSGALYGTTRYGGDRPSYGGLGTIFKLVPTATGWSEVVLHCFSGGSDGSNPSGTLIRDPSGNVFGTTIGGARSGVYIDGTVFEIVASGAFGR